LFVYHFEITYSLGNAADIDSVWDAVAHVVAAAATTLVEVVAWLLLLLLRELVIVVHPWRGGKENII
jgi:steroid 5-alpha reductase family enzyme